ncbi:MAG: archaeal proteasome endopeptidase complex subunit beta [Thermoplasmata archaeon]|nr:archaeal proteasome endopeptidase complex subunit beta [Thermoplasmata archaeon]
MENKKTGTTTVGIVTKEGVVLATEHRASMDTFIAHKTAKKLYMLDYNIGMTTAGLVGDLQVLVRYMKAEISLYRIRRKMYMPVGAAATLLSNILNERKFTPYYVGLIIGGFDNKGYHVYSIDAAGGAIEDKYASVGSGSLFVYGVLEDRWKDDLNLDEGVNLAIRGVNAAMRRDSASGDGISVATITREKGFEELSSEEVNKRLKKMKLK